MALGVGIGAGALALLLVVALVAVNLVGTQTDRPSSTASSAAPVRSQEASGPCGRIPQVTTLAGPPEPGLLVSPAWLDAMDVSRLERLFGSMRPTGTEYFATVDEVTEVLRSSDIDARRAELERDGFRGAAWRTWTSQGGDSIAVFVQEMADPEAAVRYTEHHLGQDCADSSAMLESTAVPGAVSYLNTNSAGNPQLQLVADVGDTEVNVTICACHPVDQSLATAEAWLLLLTRSLQPPSA